MVGISCWESCSAFPPPVPRMVIRIDYPPANTTREQITNLLEKGVSSEEIMAQLGVSLSTVFRAKYAKR